LSSTPWREAVHQLLQLQGWVARRHWRRRRRRVASGWPTCAWHAAKPNTHKLADTGHVLQGQPQHVKVGW